MKTIAFYSYKGGVGRSLALTNIAQRLCEFDKKVCILDFDLEAPGLVHKFENNLRGQKIESGIVDYIYEFHVNGNLPGSIQPYATEFQIYSNKKSVHFIPAGNTESREYWKKLSSINWYNLLYEQGNSIAFFLDLKNKIKQEFQPDFLLIDSRTGITETGGIAMSLLADHVVVMAANNKENFDGTQKIIKSLSNPENAILGTPPKITFVLSRIPYSDNPNEIAKVQFLESKVRAMFDIAVVPDINVIHSDKELEMDERLKIGYDKDSSSPQISRDYLNLFEKITESYLSEEEITKFNTLRMAEKHYKQAISEKQITKKLEYINNAIELNQNNLDFYRYRIYVNIDLKNFDFAIEDCRNILDKEYNDKEAIFKLALCYYEKHENQKSIDYLNQLLQIDPKYVLGYNLLGHNNLILKKYDVAIDVLSKAIAIDGNSSSAYNARGNMYKIMHEYEKAFADVYKAIELDSSNEYAHSTLAEIHAQIGNENEFYINIETALRLNKEKQYAISDDIRNFIKNDPAYQPFYKKERFKKLLEKYNIDITDEAVL